MNIYLAEKGVRVDLASFHEKVGTLAALKKLIHRKYFISEQNLIFLLSNGQLLKTETFPAQLLPDRKVYVFNNGYH